MDPATATCAGHRARRRHGTGVRSSDHEATRHEPARLELLPHEQEYLRTALAGLTSRERDVVVALCKGGANERVADRLCVALPTLRTHMMRVNQKLGTTGRAEVVALVADALLNGYRSGKITPGTGDDRQ